MRVVRIVDKKKGTQNTYLLDEEKTRYVHSIARNVNPNLEVITVIPGDFNKALEDFKRMMR